MKLTTIKIENYKCIENSEEFTIGDITCLVGKNESGKTALLQALYKLNPPDEDEAKFRDHLEYPKKGYSDYKEIRAEHPANIITTKWTLDEPELKTIEDLVGSEVFKSTEIVIKKGYENITYFDFDFDETKLIHYLLDLSGLLNNEDE